MIELTVLTVIYCLKFTCPKVEVKPYESVYTCELARDKLKDNPSVKEVFCYTIKEKPLTK